MKEEKEIRYGGFWVRFLALVIDSIVISIVFSGILSVLFQPHTIILDNHTFTSNTSAESVRSLIMLVYSVLMLYYYGSTLGKTVMGLKVETEDGKKPDLITLIIRETIGKFLSAIVLLIGFITIGSDPKKQGWHDKIAKTVVVYKNDK